MGLWRETTRLATAAWAPAGAPHGGWLVTGTLADPSARGAPQVEVFDVLAPVSKTVSGGVAAPIPPTPRGDQDLFGSSGGAEEFSVTPQAQVDVSLRPIRSSRAAAPFHRIAWGGVGRGKHGAHGVIAGGLDDGTLQVWDASALCQGHSRGSAEEALLYGGASQKRRHSGPVRGLDFNPFVTTLLASGGPENEVLVWDLVNASAPVIHHTAAPAAPSADGGSGGGGSAFSSMCGPPSQISAVAWNRRVQHILASGAGNGNAVVWDLKQKRPVISFSDPVARTRVSALAWHPEVATQIMVASDDDRSTSLKMWDLRNAHAPYRELHGHQRGVLALSWCPQDSAFLLSSGRDGRTICWDVSATAAPGGNAEEEIAFELPVVSSWYFDVQWSPCTPGLFCTSSFSGTVSVWSLLDTAGGASGAAAAAAMDNARGGRNGLGGDAFLRESFGAAAFDGSAAAPAETADAASVKRLMRAPKWHQRTCGASFGFGGQLAYFTEAAHRLGTAEVHTALDGLDEAVRRLLELIQGGYDLAQYCFERASQEGERDQVEMWQVLGALFSSSTRQRLLSILGGYQLPASALDANGGHEMVGLYLSAPLVHVERVWPATTPVEERVAAGGEYGADGAETNKPAATTDGSGGGGADHFGGFDPNGPAPWDVPASPHTDAVATDAYRGSGSGSASAAPAHRAGHATLREALLRGGLTAAIEQCIGEARVPDALLLASCAGGSVWSDTVRQCLAQVAPTDDTVRAMLGALVLADTSCVAAAVRRDNWRDILCFLLVYGSSEELATGCAHIAEQCLRLNDVQAALIAYIGGGDVSGAVRIWRAHGSVEFDLVEKVLILCEARRAAEGATGVALPEGEAMEAVEAVAQTLANNGQAELAAKLLSHAAPNSLLLEQTRRLLGEAAGASTMRTASSWSSGPSAYASNQPAAGGPYGASMPPPVATSAGQRYGAGNRTSPTTARAPVVAAYAPYGNATGQPPPRTSPDVASGMPATRPPPPVPSISPRMPAAGAPATRPMPPPPPASGSLPTTRPAPATTPIKPPAPPNSDTLTHEARSPSSRLPPSAEVASRAHPPPHPLSTTGIPIAQVDLNTIPAPYRPIATTLVRTHDACAQRAVAGLERKKIVDIDRKLGALLIRLAQQDIPEDACNKLRQLCTALDAHNLDSASNAHLQLTRDHYDGNSAWIMAIKRLLEVAARVGY